MAPITFDRRYFEQKIVKLECEIKAYIQDITENTSTLATLNELNFNVKRVIKDLQYTLDKYQCFANEQDKESDRISILTDVDKFRKQLEIMQRSLRKGNLTCQLTLDKIARDNLFNNSNNNQDDDVRKRREITRSTAARTSAGITDNLQRISQMMSSQLQHGEDTTHTLELTSSTLLEGHEELKSHSGLLQISRRLLKKFGRREFTDKILLLLAFIFFLSCVAYVVKKRVYIPGW